MQSTFQPVPSAPLRTPRSLEFALFLIGCVWLFASHIASASLAQQIVNRINLPDVDAFLEQLFFLTLLLAGFAALSWTSTRQGSLREVNALPRRETSRQEWKRGAALGWAMLLVTVLPLMFAGDLQPQFWFQPRAWFLTLLSLGTMALGTLALEVAYRGYIYKRLIGAINPVAATILLATIYAVVSSYHDNSTVLSTLITCMMGILFSMAYLRTHALWLGWGLHFAWAATTSVLFGMPVSGYPAYSFISTNLGGREWFSGGAYGAEGSVIALVIVLAAMPVLYRITRGYAWAYTHPPIVAAGYAVVVAPPAAHVAMEEATAAAPAPLVQILGKTSTNASTMPVIEEHLRGNSAS